MFAYDTVILDRFNYFFDFGDFMTANHDELTTVFVHFVVSAGFEFYALLAAIVATLAVKVQFRVVLLHGLIPVLFLGGTLEFLEPLLDTFVVSAEDNFVFDESILYLAHISMIARQLEWWQR